MTKTKCTRCGRAIEVKLITRCDWCDGKVANVTVHIDGADIAQALAARRTPNDVCPKCGEQILTPRLDAKPCAHNQPPPRLMWPPTLERK